MKSLISLSRDAAYYVICHLLPNPMAWRQSRQRYFAVTGKHLDYADPKDINEKMMWLTRYWRHPLKTYCADKLLVRNYVADCGFADILIPLIGT